MPISQLKPQSKTLFDALGEGKSVLVTRHGRIVAAFDPASTLPVELLALYALGERMHVLTAGSIGQNAPSKEIEAAEQGMPTLVAKGHRLVGVIRPARAQPPTAASFAEAQILDKAIDDFLADSPESTAIELASFTTSWKERQELPPTHAEAPWSAVGFDAGSQPDEVEVSSWLANWRKQGSVVEEQLGQILLGAANGLEPFASQVQKKQVPAEVERAIEESGNCVLNLLINAVRAGARDRPSEVRLHCTAALVADIQSSATAMWLLGDSSRSQLAFDEAVVWYGLAHEAKTSLSSD